MAVGHWVHGDTREDGTPHVIGPDGLIVGCRKCGGKPGPVKESGYTCLACGYDVMGEAYGWGGAAYRALDTHANREEGIEPGSTPRASLATAEELAGTDWDRVAWLDGDPGMPAWYRSEGPMDADPAGLPGEVWFLGDGLNGLVAASGDHFRERFEPVWVPAPGTRGGE